MLPLIRLLVAASLCQYARSALWELTASFYPLTAVEQQALLSTGTAGFQLGRVNASEADAWLESLQALQGPWSGYVNYQTQACSVQRSCTKAVKVNVLEWAPNTDASSGYILVAATTTIAGANHTWDAAFNPHHEFLVSASNSTAIGGDGWVVQLAPDTVKLMDASPAPFKGRRQLLLGENADECGRCHQSCFPGEAMVLLQDGSYRFMYELKIGDKVAVLGKDDKYTYDYVYAFGHQDHATKAVFTNLLLEGSNHSISLSGGHFILVASGSNVKSFKRARNIAVGDVVWATSGGYVTPHKVSGVGQQTLIGMFNPLTLSGNIIVNGVAASVHSDWFLDPIAEKLGLVSSLPHAYQVILAPARILWYLLGKDNYTRLYHFFDRHVDGIDKFGSAHGGKVVGTSLCVLSLLAAACAYSSVAKP